MSNEASVIPPGPLVVPPATLLLLLLTGVERAIPKIALSLLVAETSTALIPSKVPAVLIIWEVVSAIALLTRGSIPV
jgi:hypothetical protein